MPDRAPASTLRALVAGLVDYAGLFPPAASSMAAAVAAYASYRDAPESWMLGRFVVPVARLDEMADAASHLGAVARIDPWRIAMLPAEDLPDALRCLQDFNVAHRGRFCIDVMECKVATPADIERAARTIGDAATLYVEVPIADDPAPFLDVARAANVRAKVRTGGLTPEAFPSAAHLARFIVRCAQREVPFKATAGLHHPIRGEHRLTYEADAARAPMFGFLNVFAAAAFALGGLPEPAIVRLLEETDPSAFRFDDSALDWDGHLIDLDHLLEARASFAIAFGSCSFREPVDDLKELGLL